MELTSGLAVAQPDSAALRPWGVQLISRPIGQSAWHRCKEEEAYQ
jgi:hypothetical protein